ncbi:ATP-binding protein [Stenotrophomonas sp. SY1]|jgi:two-component system sensor histidine kinase RegB|uniref:ATP-binding protein n=1 Tax=Stenotrophomonas sp. SY1 TaxID=477235 RepID=UPI001E529889|nr:ATP-binding protein [Stenotrophomonas sp. SY1]MCD9088805.1 ATP-binding protein [Stenotrophomonas sp. SY1]
MNAPDTSFLRTLCSLRWLATAGQATTILLASALLGLELPLVPLWAGVLVLALFNLYVQLRVHDSNPAPVTAFGHILVDVTVLTWMVGWSGGIANPFGSLFLILIALAALALPLRWTHAVAAACVAGYALSAVFGLPLEGGYFDSMSLHLWGAAANFLLSSVVVLVFSTRLAAALRERENQLALLRERFVRNEGIVALATHAASVAHELNTPLATMTLITDDIAEQCADNPEMRDDLETLRELLVQCRERVLALAAPAEGARSRAPVSIGSVLEQWRLVRPTIQLRRNANAPLQMTLDPGVGHLLQVLLNNAADAGEFSGRPQIDLDIRVQDGQLYGEVRDYGPGFNANDAALPGSLFNSSKTESMGVGLALSHATIERLHGELWMRPAEGQGARVGFRLPLDNPEVNA